ncbi:MAG: CBS domain-containing protein [Planctomycetaceae bacterium]
MLLQDMFHNSERVVTVAPDQPLRHVGQLMQDGNVGAVVVAENNRLIGIVTDRDLALALSSGEATRDTPVKNVMQRKVHTIWADQGVFDACQAFAGYQVRRLPVVDRRDKLVGIISADDVVAMLARELFNISKALEPALHVKM